MKKIIVTHRGIASKIKKYKSEMLIKAKKSSQHSYWDKLWEDKECVVWISLGCPNFWDRINSGMIGRNGEASVSFLNLNTISVVRCK